MIKGEMLYTVSGSEDGVLHTYADKTEARKRAKDYIWDSVPETEWDGMVVRENKADLFTSRFFSEKSKRTSVVERWIV